MIQLKYDQYPVLSGLFEPLRVNLVIDSVLEGNTPAQVYADQLYAPTAGLIWDMQDAVLVSGRLVEALYGILEDTIIPEARKRRIPELSIYYPFSDWAAPITARLGNYRPETTGRRYYQFEQLRVNWREALPEGFGIRRIDLTLLNSRDILNAEEAAGWVRSFWASDEDFTRAGFGYCVMSQDSIASWCLTVFASRNQRELAVATVADQRGKGLASAVAAACVEHCVANGYRPQWHCLNENIASWKVAEKIGFRDPVSYATIRIRI